VTAIRIEGFAGIAPRYSDRLLPPQAATIASNVKLLSGELRGLHEIRTVADFSALPDTYRRAFRIPGNINIPIPFDSGADTWIPFEDEAVDFTRSPVLGDSFERYYWTGDSTVYPTVPKYNTRARLINADPPYRLGIPRPVAAPIVTPAGAGNASRVYLYTFVSSFGEEGQPSDPSLLTTGDQLLAWDLTGLDTTVPDPTERDIVAVRIYRTIPGFTSTQFFFVDDIPLATGLYSDVKTDEEVAQNQILESTTWAEPPATLLGLTVHPGGFLIGFDGRDLYMSEPFRPHAWPVEYILTAQTEIVGLAVFNNTIIVTTNSHPYVGEGITPISINLQKLDSIDPCLSRRSMVTTLAGVMYASVQGIISIGLGGLQLMTRSLFTRQEWYDRFNPGGVKAVPYGLQYIAFDTPQSGFIFSPDEQLAPLTELDRFDRVDGIQIDAYTGDVYLLRANRVALWDPLDTLPYSYQWKSKVFDAPSPVNFGALQVKFRNQETEIDLDAIADYTAFNTIRITKPLNCVNLAPVIRVKTMVVPSFPYAQNKTPTGGSPLFNLTALQVATPAVTIRVFARRGNSTTEEVFSYTVTDEGVYRLPADFMSDVWQVEIVSNTDVYSFAIAETAKELAKV